MKQTDFTAIRCVWGGGDGLGGLNCGRSHVVVVGRVMCVVGRVRVISAVVWYLQRLRVHDAVAHKIGRAHV